VYAYLIEEHLFLDRNYTSPDFIVTKYGKTVAIEAVIVNRKSDNPPKYFREHPVLKTQNEILAEHENAMPIRFGSPVFFQVAEEILGITSRQWQSTSVCNCRFS